MALEFLDISKTFLGRSPGESVHVLEQIRHRIENGQFVSIVGPSGCGKTTLLRIIAGLEESSSGKVLLDGKELSQGSEEVGLVFQEYALFPWRTTLQNIEMGPEIKGVDKEKRRLTAMEYIRTFDLNGFEHRYPRELSGGMKQRVAIARTLIMNPRVVLMDEPFGSLDSQTRNGLQEFLLGIWERRRDTILFVTHNVDEAVFLSDQIIVLSKRPARIFKTFEVGLQRPRDRTGYECNEIRREVLKVLSREA
ncbi:MAG TPA: ABC transporter ATP-binding protein [Thermodesulfobacteriota bacterium]|nr:ABC transporter ATP-binding protein [Thermodesulfobacteriota bacterium]